MSYREHLLEKTVLIAILLMLLANVAPSTSTIDVEAQSQGSIQAVGYASVLDQGSDIYRVDPRTYLAEKTIPVGEFVECGPNNKLYVSHRYDIRSYAQLPKDDYGTIIDKDDGGESKYWKNMAFSPSGNLFASTREWGIRVFRDPEEAQDDPDTRVVPDGLGEIGFSPHDLTFLGDDLLAVNMDDRQIMRIPGPDYSSVEVFIDDGLNDPSGIAVDSDGNVFVADFGAGEIKKFSSTGKPLQPNPSGTGYDSDEPFASLHGVNQLEFTSNDTLYATKHSYKDTRVNGGLFVFAGKGELASEPIVFGGLNAKDVTTCG